MAASASNNARPPATTRKANVRVPFESEATFVAGFSSHVTRGGVFIPMREPIAAGTELKFSLNLRSGTPVLHGTGVVLWTRSAPEPRPGVGLMFLEIAPECRPLVERIVRLRGPEGEAAEPPDGLDHSKEPGPVSVPQLAPSTVPNVAPLIGSVAPRIAPSVAPAIAPAIESPPTPVPARLPRAAPALDLSGELAAAMAEAEAHVASPAPSTRTSASELDLPPELATSFDGPYQHAPSASVPLPAPAREEASPPGLRRNASAAPRFELDPPLPAGSVIDEAAAANDEVPEAPAAVASAHTAQGGSTESAANRRNEARSSEPLDFASANGVDRFPDSAAPSSPRPAPLEAASLFGTTGSEIAAPREDSPHRTDLPPNLEAAFAPSVRSEPASAPVPTPAAPAPVPAPMAEAPIEADGRSAEPRTPTRGIEALRVTRAIDSLRKKDYAKAEAELQRAVADQPENARLRLELGLVYFEWSDGEGADHDGAAEACFARAAELDPESDQALVYLGQVQLRRRMLAPAENAFKLALQRNPHSRAAKDGLALCATVRWKERTRNQVFAAVAIALVIAGGVWLVRPAPTDAIAAEGANARAAPVAAAAQPITPAAQPQAAPSANAAPANPAATTTASVTAPGTAPAAEPKAADDAQKPAQVAAADAPQPKPEPVKVAAAVKPAPERDEPVRSRKRTRSSRRSREDSAEEPTKKVEKAEKPQSSGGGSSKVAQLVRSGDAALRSGRPDEALAAFKEAIQLDPKASAAHRGLGSVYVMLGQDGDAVAAYKKYLSLAPNASDAGRIQSLIQGLQ